MKDSADMQGLRRVFFKPPQLERTMEPQQKASTILPAIANEYGELFLQGVNRNTFMGKHSRTIYRSWFGDKYLEENALYIILGTDSGLLIDYFLAEEIPSGTRILFVEHPEIIAWLGENKPNLLGKRDQLQIVDSTEFTAGIETYNLENYIYLDTFFITRSFGVSDLFYEPYQEMSQNVLQAAENYHWSVKSALSTKPFTINQLWNLADDHIHVSVLDNAFSGQSAILLAGGPSLEMIIPWLKEHGDEVAILTVSRISRRLKEVGVTPDIIFSIDPNPINFNVSREMFHFADHALLVNLFHLYPQLLGQWKGRHVYSGDLFPWQTPLNRSLPQRSGSTVTNFALETAINMGFSTIYLAGVDLCYDTRGFTHAKGSIEHAAGPMLEGGETIIATNDGRVAQTTFAYKTAAGNLASLATWAREEKQARVINTNPGAAKMEGIEYAPVEQIELEPVTHGIQKTITDFLHQDTQAGRREHCHTVLTELNRAVKALQQIQDLSTKALMANKKLFKGRQRQHRYVQEMDRIEKELNSERFAFIRKMVKTYGLANFLSIIRADEHAQWSEKEIEESGRKYYQAYRKSAKELLKLIDQCEERIKARIEEEERQPDFALLFKTWQRDGMPGRALILEEHNPDACRAADKKKRKRLEEFKDEFTMLVEQGIQLAKTPLAHLSEWNQQKAKKVRARILDLFHQRDKETLQGVADELAVNSQDLVQPLSNLANGLLRELDGDPKGARDFYQKLIEQGEQIDPLLLEDALQHICSISLDQGEEESAILALQCLYDLSVTYGPQYAKILTLTGQADQALDVYADYLGKIPDDIDAMLALGNLYRQLNFSDGVAMVVEHVLKLAPDNPQALELRDFCNQ